jgi:hypothetical protein
MHTYKLRPHILNSRVPGCMLQAFLTRAGDPNGPLYLQPGYLLPGYLDRCSCTTGRYICRIYRCIIAADPDKNGLGIPDKNPSRTRERTCTHTMRRRCRSDHTPQHTHIHSHIQHIHAGNVLCIPLARERAESGSRVLRSLPVLASLPACIRPFCGPVQKKKHGGPIAYRALCVLRTLTMYVHAPPSVRPSLFFLLLHPIFRVLTVCDEPTPFRGTGST